MKSPLRRLIDHYGSFTAAGEALDLHRTTVARWMVIPEEYALDVAELDIGISAEDVLRAAKRGKKTAIDPWD